MSEKPIDADLVTRARAGDREAFGELYRRYFGPIFRYLCVRVDRAEDAEDLAGTVFLRAYRSLDRYREQGWPFSAFLYQVARNALVDHYRKPRPETELDQAEGLGTPMRGLDEELEMAEQVRMVQQVMTGLSADYQEVIRLRVLLGLPTETVAQWMGRSEGAVRVMLFRALSALRARLSEEDEGSGREEHGPGSS
jgi:RNA polymerase sigma-70 factor (ECF subfamily)